MATRQRCCLHASLHYQALHYLHTPGGEDGNCRLPLCVPRPMVLAVEKSDCPELCPEGLDSENQLPFPFWRFLLVQTKVKGYLKILESDTQLRVRK